VEWFRLSSDELPVLDGAPAASPGDGNRDDTSADDRVARDTSLQEMASSLSAKDRLGAGWQMTGWRMGMH